MKRRSDSVRFTPYFKIQWWSDRSMAWVDVQDSHATVRDACRTATSSGNPGDRYRIMMVRPGGRRPVLEGSC